MTFLQDIRARGLSDDEIVAALESVRSPGTTQQTAKRTWELQNNGETIAKYALNAAGEPKILEVPDRHRVAVLSAVDEDAGAPTYSTVAVTLFSYRPIYGFARVQDWIQLRPVPEAPENRTGVPSLFGHVPGAPPIPFALEIRCRRSAMWVVDPLRLERQIRQAIWLITAFLEVVVFQPKSPYAFVSIDGRAAVARCAAPQAPLALDGHVFSDVTGLRELEVVPHDQYFSELGINTKELRVPDLQSLWIAFNALSAEHRRRFLRACAALTAAASPDTDKGHFVVSLVTSIEALLDPSSETCAECGSKIGANKTFKEFLQTYVQGSTELLQAHKDLYGNRSRLAHGALQYDVDEPAFGVRDTSFVTRLAAWSAAKRGLTNWLFAKATLPPQ